MDNLVFKGNIKQLSLNHIVINISLVDGKNNNIFTYSSGHKSKKDL